MNDATLRGHLDRLALDRLAQKLHFRRIEITIASAEHSLVVVVHDALLMNVLDCRRHDTSQIADGKVGRTFPLFHEITSHEHSGDVHAFGTMNQNRLFRNICLDLHRIHSLNDQTISKILDSSRFEIFRECTIW